MEVTLDSNIILELDGALALELNKRNICRI
jgi:hypothetical protein